MGSCSLHSLNKAPPICKHVTPMRKVLREPRVFVVLPRLQALCGPVCAHMPERTSVHLD